MSGDGGVWLVLPTYDERDNLERMVHAVRAALPVQRRVLIVDDASPDGTGEIAARLAAAHEDVDVLHRPRKLGLGPALVDGLGQALQHGAELIAQMDCDFSHDPEDLPLLLATAGDADLVLGSRYVAGGAVSGWGAARRAVSRGGSAYARRVLGIGVRDLTGGFKVYRREVLAAIDLPTVGSLGYAFQVETTYRAITRGFRVVEVPIVFRDRRVGQSKMSKRIVAEAAWRVPAMRFRESGA